MNIDYRTALIGLLLILLFLSAGLSYKLVKRNRFLTRELARTLLDPLALSYFDEQSFISKNRQDMTKVLFFGDSRAATWPNPEMDDSFVFINRGIDGQSSAQAVLRFEAHVVPVQPDVVVVQVCVNDLWRIPVFPDEKEAIIQRCQENLAEIVTKSTDLGATVLLTTIFPVHDPPLMQRMYWSTDVYDAIDTVNETIRSLAKDDVLVLDAYELLRDENGRLHTQYAADYLHLNETGYQVLNEALIDMLESVDTP
ncbi:MAG: SGNH/GDSL hydrolase family protein, partial [Anaerolineae bacterium]|nr:SGNH/GDSL hydrolase family protein [Anaerolineae bacterium]